MTGMTLREQLLPFAKGTQKACLKKHRYGSEDDANKVIGKRLRTHDENVPADGKLYAYPCPHCGGWHISKLNPNGGEIK